MRRRPVVTKARDAPTLPRSQASPTLPVETAAPSEPRLVGRAVDAIGRAIVNGEFLPGSQLPNETELCRSLQVSRTIVREAVKTIVGKGLLRTGRGSGTVVLPRKQWRFLDIDVLRWIAESDGLRPELLEQLTTLRSMIEPEVAAAAAQKATTVEVLRIFEAYEDMVRYSTTDALKAVDADIRFHERIFDAARNELIGSMIPIFSVLLRANFNITVRFEGAFIRNLEEHLHIAEAIRDRKPHAARRAMLQLLANNNADLAEMLADREMVVTPRR